MEANQKSCVSLVNNMVGCGKAIAAKRMPIKDACAALLENLAGAVVAPAE